MKDQTWAIVDNRRTGRTTRLLIHAKEQGATFVVPTSAMVRSIKLMPEAEGVEFVTLDSPVLLRGRRIQKTVCDHTVWEGFVPITADIFFELQRTGV